jgi:ADP-ribose pyrophosphatase YjhB (NUDIX family)
MLQHSDKPDLHEQREQRTLLKRTLANWLKRFPWMGVVVQRLYRWWQPWRTVGAVGVVVNDEGHILIVEHVFHPKFPWGLPGGWMGHHEDPDETVQREVFEETGLRVKVVRPLLVEHTPFLARHLDVSYLCRVEPGSGEITLSNELLDYRWIDPDDDEVQLKRAHLRAIEAARSALTPPTP